MAKNLVIVESPAKARTIEGYLGKDFVVESSVGHIRGLPNNAKEIPEAYKKEPWARLGVNVESDFKPIYVVQDNRKDQIRNLKKLLKEADKLYLATDEDREGEAIAWHLLEVLSPPAKMEVHRMVFHEITKEAIEQAIQSPRDVNRNLVDAQEARRILDRLYGYEVSPVLWRKVKSKLSAGRVQSVATRILVEREKARMAFKSAEFAELKVNLKFGADEFEASLEEIDKTKVAKAADFDARGQLLNSDKTLVLNQSEAEELAKAMSGAEVAAVKSRPHTRRPSPPLTTSALQQAAGNRYAMSSAMIMSAAQALYEAGHITYMRTDANNLSEAALKSARAQIKTEFGTEYLSESVRTYKNKAKNAQEAHEAIRPTGDTFITPREMAQRAPKAQSQVYELIYERTLASQMTDETGEVTTYTIKAESNGRELMLRAGGTVITHEGFQKVLSSNSKSAASKTAKPNGTLQEDASEAEDSDESELANLPQMAETDTLEVASHEVRPKETRPPARFTEARIVAEMEQLGVGRPSTYASTIKTILDRDYAWKNGSQIVPTFTAIAVVQLLDKHFPDLVDYNFTAHMEDDLDQIAMGKRESVEWLNEFYFGDKSAQTKGLKEMVEVHLEEIDARAVCSVPLGKNAKGEEVEVRVGQYGPFVSRGEETASIPVQILPDELTLEEAEKIIDNAGHAGRVLGTDPESKMTITVEVGRYGPYVRLGNDKELGIEKGAKRKKTDPKPKMASLFQAMTPEAVTLEEALQLLSLPRVVGEIDGEEVIVANGKYGPYLKKGSDSRSLDTEEELLEMDLNGARAILAQPKKFRRRTNSLNIDLGDDPLTGLKMTVKSGSFGPYVTDGEVNASIRDTIDPKLLTPEQASELLSNRRDRIAANPPKPKKKAAAKK